MALILSALALTSVFIQSAGHSFGKLSALLSREVYILRETSPDLSKQIIISASDIAAPLIFTTIIAKGEAGIEMAGYSDGGKSTYITAGLLAIILLSGLLFWMVTTRQAAGKTSAIERIGQIHSASRQLPAEEHKEKSGLIKLRQPDHKPDIAVTHSQPDHSLALKVAGEINLIERNVRLMDPKARGINQLQAAVSKLKEYLATNGYEIPELLGKELNYGTKIIVVSTVSDESPDNDREIITRIITPQVNYLGSMIQTAEVEISKGYNNLVRFKN